MAGPLQGIRVIELVGQGPGPYGAMVLADLGADVIAVERPEVAARVNRDRLATNPMMRGKRSIALDLKSPTDIATLLDLTDRADAFIDPFRPGVCERLGIGPDVVCERNPRMIYGRMTGWGQDGPLAHTAGHDIDYISLSGALHLIGYEGQPPTPPINLLGDFAGGGLVLAMGVACAVVERFSSGRGQVIDTAMVDGAAMILGPFSQHSLVVFGVNAVLIILMAGLIFTMSMRRPTASGFQLGLLNRSFMLNSCSVLEQLMMPCCNQPSRTIAKCGRQPNNAWLRSS